MKYLILLLIIGFSLFAFNTIDAKKPITPSTITTTVSQSIAVPGDIVTITADGFTPNTSIQLAIANPGCCLHTVLRSDSAGHVIVSWVAQQQGTYIFTFREQISAFGKKIRNKNFSTGVASFIVQ